MVEITDMNKKFSAFFVPSMSRVLISIPSPFPAAGAAVGQQLQYPLNQNSKF